MFFKKQAVVQSTIDAMKTSLGVLNAQADSVFDTFRRKIEEIDNINDDISACLDQIAKEKAELEALQDSFSTSRETNMKIRAKFTDFLS